MLNKLNQLGNSYECDMSGVCYGVGPASRIDTQDKINEIIYTLNLIIERLEALDDTVK